MRGVVHLQFIQLDLVQQIRPKTTGKYVIFTSVKPDLPKSLYGDAYL